MFCENCGKKLPDEAKFCNGCGTKILTENPANKKSEQPAVNNLPPANSTPPQNPPQQSYTQKQTYTPQQTYIPPYMQKPGREPLSVGQYILMFLLLSIPLVGTILLFVWSFGSAVNLNKKNFSRAMLILSAIGLIFAIVAGGIIIKVLGELFSEFGGYY